MVSALQVVTHLETLARDQHRPTALRVMRVGLVLRAVQAVSAQVSALQVGTHSQRLERVQRPTTALRVRMADM